MDVYKEPEPSIHADPRRTQMQRNTGLHAFRCTDRAELVESALFPPQASRNLGHKWSPASSLVHISFRLTSPADQPFCS